MTKEISAGIEGDTELGDQVSNHTVQYLLLDHRDTKCVCTGSSWQVFYIDICYYMWK